MITMTPRTTGKGTSRGQIPLMRTIYKTKEQILQAETHIYIRSSKKVRVILGK